MKKFELLLFSEYMYVQIVNEYGWIDKEAPREKDEKILTGFQMFLMVKPSCNWTKDIITWSQLGM